MEQAKEQMVAKSPGLKLGSDFVRVVVMPVPRANAAQA